MLSRDKRSSLFGLIVSDGEKKLFNIDSRSAPFMHDIADYYKDFEKLHLVTKLPNFFPCH